jgi:hypothetical protein
VIGIIYVLKKKNGDNDSEKYLKYFIDKNNKPSFERATSWQNLTQTINTNYK